MNASRLARFAWTVLVFNLIVILWGAYVRASGSGAGCGSHWPLCNGEVMPRAPRIETIIELTHRATSGIALLLVVALAVWAWRATRRGSAVRRAALASLFFIILEALIGAGLVLLEYVADNASIARAFWMAGHLVNTFLLLAALALTAWSASGGPLPKSWGGLGWALAGALAGMILLGVSGAVTALGDTLFPARSLSEGINQDFSPAAHALLRLRVWHPLIAVVVGSYTVGVPARARARRPSTHPLAAIVIALVVAQLAAGLINLLLLAPTWMQLVHLLLADLLWIALVLLAAFALAHEREATEAEPGGVVSTVSS